MTGDNGRAGGLILLFVWGLFGGLSSQNPDADLDHDGIPDSLEQRLADRYAPLVLMDPKEPNLPMDAETFLTSAELWYFDKSCSDAHRRKIASHPAVPIPSSALKSCDGNAVDPLGTRSAEKKHTFFWKDLDGNRNAGSLDSSHWTTYYHAYLNNVGGITIQYWRFYPYNTGYFAGMKVWIGCHGGDWEAVHVVLGAGPDYRQREIRLLGHKNITTYPWSAVITQGEHPIIRADKGGHTSLLARESDVARQSSFLRQESWSGGRVYWAGGSRTTPGGELKNLGEKTFPIRGMEFIQYSGLWGTRKDGLFGFYRSGYWGPAYNETSIREDNFISAWCEGIRDPNREVVQPDGETIRECFPAFTIP